MLATLPNSYLGPPVKRYDNQSGFGFFNETDALEYLYPW
jgi:hypothetical protein